MRRRLQRFVPTAVLILAGGIAARAQEFEVATIKPIVPDVTHEVGIHRIYPGGRIIIGTFTLKDLIHAGFNVPWSQISGGDSWIEKDQYDVEARPPANLKPPITDVRHGLYEIEDERLRAMLQALLAARFQLRFHRETKTGKVYLLERSGKAIRLLPAKAPDDKTPDAYRDFSSIGWAGRWVITDTSMEQFARFAGNFYLRAPVLDRTGLSGQFDYYQRTREPDTEAAAADSTGSFLELITELGLKLQATQGPVETFIIDHMEKPSPN